MYDNKAAFLEGMKLAESLAYEHFVVILQAFCSDLFQSADREKEYHNLTGNTFTSYMCGIYKDGRLIEVLASADYKKDPVRLKLSHEWWRQLVDGPDYDGVMRDYYGTVRTDRGIGEATSFTFLRNYTPSVSKGYAVVMCTGTEYSEFLEKVAHSNVLTNTWLEAQGLFFRNLKKIA